MMEAMHSTPKYQSLDALNWNAPAFLVLTQSADSALAQQLELRLQPHQKLQVLSLPDAADESFAHFCNQVQASLQQAKAGMHTVICGDESFMWMMQQCAVRSGSLKEEISLLLEGGIRQAQMKKVYCVHCGHTQKTSADDFCACANCQVELLIRSHFSERLGAYMGVCANAHQPMGAAS
ncbi:dimethylamine monooxygenase subunit DmmA family protein [Acinetobacter sp. YH12063]|uniref:dimethylamine monooxygenase subunit DmmA family protein n=1 Tax=Acinetobacter sp. YH12063 TaxID=2601061 RepID=UPI0015D36FC1|nr:dimethylamine monooxygenase subunit DmmA family protein [Acinetobacter sp. YH12063]